MKSRGGRTWKEIGRTELLENTLDPEWSKAFLLDYYFEEKQVSKLTYLFLSQIAKLFVISINRFKCNKLS